MTQPQDIATLIDAYLDGAMTAEEQAAFERRAETDPALREQLSLQKRIDGRLRILMEAPAFAPAPPAIAGKIAPRRPFGPQWMGIAAVLLLGALGIWALIAQPWSPGYSNKPADAYLASVVKSGFKPMGVCENDQGFRDYTQKNLGVSFLVKPRPGVEIVGWNYASDLLESTAQVLLARVDCQPEIVVMGKKEDDRRVYVERGSGMKVHRKECSGLVFYEVNNRDDQPVIDGVQAPGCK